MRESVDGLQIVYPPQSIIHEPHIALVDAVVDARDTRAVADAYLRFLYTPEGQEIIAKNFFRPSDPDVLQKHKAQFPKVQMFTITDFVPGWEEAQVKFFGAGALFVELYDDRFHQEK